MIKNFLNPEGHQNRISGSKVTAILLKGCILPIGGASSVEGMRSMGLPRLVFKDAGLTLNLTINVYILCDPRKYIYNWLLMPCWIGLWLVR